MSKSLLGISAINLYGERIAEITLKAPTDGKGNRAGPVGVLEQQLTENNPGFARIYGFSFEGAYYHLPHAVLFLVHGDGEPVTNKDTGQPNDAHAPRKPEIGGVGAADFEYADDIYYWTYDTEDISIRLDAESGRFEEILLSTFLDGGFDPSGINARGINARGINARGINARGINARGINARGINARGGSKD